MLETMRPTWANPFGLSELGRLYSYVRFSDDRVISVEQTCSSQETVLGSIRYQSNGNGYTLFNLASFPDNLQGW